MDEPTRQERYRKDERREELLRRINRLIRHLDLQVGDARVPKLPVVFIVGAPQSATTLMSQIFSNAGCFGYVSNFTARFFEAPAFGMLVQQALSIGDGETESYASEFGVTSGWRAPHEFGYFWDRFFDLGQEVHKITPALFARVDRDGLRAAVARMEQAAGRPMVFKNNTWCTFQIAFLQELFRQSVWVVCQRHPLYNAQSIALGRRLRYGDIRTWWSVRPAQYRELLSLPWWEQVAGQLRHTVDEIEAGLSGVDPRRVVRVRYEELCRDPGAPLRRVADIAHHDGVAIAPREPAFSFTSQDVKMLPDEEWAMLRETCIHWFGAEYDGWNMESGQDD